MSERAHHQVFPLSRYTKEDDEAFLARRAEFGETLFASFSDADLADDSAAPHLFPWIWRGYLARQMVSLLVSRAKSGKTTMVNSLVRKLRSAGTFAGMPIEPAKVTIVTEEHPSIWRQRQQNIPFGNHVRWYYRPFLLKPTFAQWKLLIDCIAHEAKTQGIDLIVLDSVSTLFPANCECNIDLMMRALEPLEILRRLNLAVLVVHHPSKRERKQGEMARGSSALTASVDITMELDYYLSHDEGNRRRILRGYSRFEETPAAHVIEWTEDGSDYLGHGPLAQVRFLENWARIEQILKASVDPLTIDEILERWPADSPFVDRTTVWRWLRKAISCKFVEAIRPMFFRSPSRGRPLYFALADRAQYLRTLDFSQPS